MFDRIVVPLDAPEEAETLLGALSDMLGPRPGAEILLLNAEGLEGVAFRHFPDSGRVRILRRPEAPLEAILEAVGASERSLVALTARDRRGQAGLLFGSVTERVLRDCPAPVLAVRGEGRPPQVLLLPMDESPDWKAAAACAIDLARRHEARVVVLRTAEEVEGAAALRQAQEACGALVAAGVVAHAFAEEGPPGRTILAAAAAHEADLIVMATRSERRQRPRAVTEEILHGARVSLMTVPAAMVRAWRPAVSAAAEE